MKTTFRTYCGLAGDLQELLTARSAISLEVSELIPRTGILRYYRMRRAKKRLLRKLELLTGVVHYEDTGLTVLG